jgi:hypothetical protein
MENVGPYSTIREEISVTPEQFFQLPGEAAGISPVRRLMFALLESAWESIAHFLALYAAKKHRPRHKRDADAAVSWIEGETTPFDSAVGLVSFEDCCTLCRLEPSVVRDFFRQSARDTVVADPQTYGDFVDIAQVRRKLALRAKTRYNKETP